jgi:hypothetical protein
MMLIFPVERPLLQPAVLGTKFPPPSIQIPLTAVRLLPLATGIPESHNMVQTITMRNLYHPLRDGLRIPRKQDITLPTTTMIR